MAGKISAIPLIPHKTRNEWGTRLHAGCGVRVVGKVFALSDQRGPGGPHSSRPGGRRYEEKALRNAKENEIGR